MRKTKIVCTIGPASASVKALKDLAKAGMNVARINMSHGTYEEHLATIEAIKKVRTQTGLPIAIMLDLKGPEIRIKSFKNGKVMLGRGKKFVLTTRKIEGNENEVSITSDKLAAFVKPKQKLLLSDGSIELSVVEVKNKDIVCTVKVGGELSNNKSINVPGVEIPMEYLSQVDRLDILFGIAQGMDLLAISFVQSAADVAEVRKFLAQNGCEDVLVVSKIESARGVKNMDEIIRASDGVMVARGDMGVEVDFVKLPHIQNELLAKCLEYKKFSITATQMLESMTQNNRPTRAEVTDIANAVLGGSGAVMLSGETAVGKHPALCVKTMAAIAAECEKHIDFKHNFNEIENKNMQINQSVCGAAVLASFSASAKAILVSTGSGATAREVSACRPKVQILALTPNSKTFYQMAVLFGVCPIKTKLKQTEEAIKEQAKEEAIKSAHLEKGDVVVHVIGSPSSKLSNSIRIENI